MNKKKRESLKIALSVLERAHDMVSYVLDEERDSLYNMPENLQASEGYERMEESVDSLEEVVGYIDEAMSGIDNAM